MSHDIAKEREIYAKTLSQKDIWRSVVRNAIKMKASVDMKADILLNAIPDLGVIYGHLRFNNKIGDLDNKEFFALLEIILNKLEIKRNEIEFNPLMTRTDE